jgi:hypothetical protein
VTLVTARIPEAWLNVIRRYIKTDEDWYRANVLVTYFADAERLFRMARSVEIALQELGHAMDPELAGKAQKEIRKHVEAMEPLVLQLAKLTRTSPPPSAPGSPVATVKPPAKSTRTIKPIAESKPPTQPPKDKSKASPDPGAKPPAAPPPASVVEPSPRPNDDPPEPPRSTTPAF